MQKSQKAISLVELIIATGIVFLVIWGMTSTELIFHKSSRDYSSKAVVAASTVATLNHILNNASKAVGSDGVIDSDLGILVPDAGASRTFCIHQKPTSNSDQWYCYSQIDTRIFACIKSYVVGIPYRGADYCADTDQYIGGAVAGTIAISPLNPNFNLSNLTFTITINNCLYPALATCNATAHDPNNPYVSKTGSISPPQHSFSN